MKKKIIILGSSGFFGKAIINKLKKKKALNIFGISKSQNLDLTDFRLTLKKFKKIMPDVIINCAGSGGSVHYVAKHPAAILNENISMYLNIYKAASKLKKKPKIINTICNCVYTGNMKFQNEGKWDEGKVHDSVYTTGNIHRLRYVISRAWSEQFNIKSINLIFGGFFGPGDHLKDDRLHAFDGIIFRLVKAFKKKQKKFYIYGSGKPVREWIYIDDAVKAIEIAMNIKDEIINPINITNNYSVPVKDIALKTSKILNFKGKILNDKNYIDGDMIKKMDKQSKRYKKYFRKLKYTNIDLSIMKTINYYLENIKN